VQAFRLINDDLVLYLRFFTPWGQASFRMTIILTDFSAVPRNDCLFNRSITVAALYSFCLQDTVGDVLHLGISWMFYMICGDGGGGNKFCSYSAIFI
jgi:hypothetical protein